MRKKYHISILLILFSVSSNAQKIQEYTAINAITYKIMDTVHLGRGSSPNGDFLYLQMGKLGAFLSHNSNQLNISKGLANTAVIVKKITKEKIKGVQKVVFSVGAGDISNDLLYIDEAIQTCEVIPCKTTSTPTGSVADEIAKLKALLDSGAITKEEYEAQKKKLLGQ